MEFWIGVTISAVIGFALGAVVVWLVDRKRGGGTSVATLKQEHENFREQVTTHFVETAELINKLTDSYKDVFDHLSKGAEKLVDDQTLRERMPKVSDQEVRLKRLGTRSAGGEGAASEGRAGSKSAAGSSDTTRPAAAARRTDAESGGSPSSGTGSKSTGGSPAKGPGDRSTASSSSRPHSPASASPQREPAKGSRSSSEGTGDSAAKPAASAKTSSTAASTDKSPRGS